MSFSIVSYENRDFPPFNWPEIIGYFSLSGQERKYSEDFKQLKYYYDHHGKNVHFNLNEGLDKVIKKPKDLDEKIDFLLRWILNNHTTIRHDSLKKRWLKPEFVCFRGLLTKIGCTLYENKDSWIISAAKFQGTIYLCAFDTPDQIKRNANLSKRELQCQSWGFKFEQYLLSDSPNQVPNTKEPVNEAEEFCCLFSSKLGQNELLFGAEMDGVCSKNVVTEPVDWNSLRFVELKTKKVARNNFQKDNYKKRLLKWWCQSFLVGIDNVICGNRTESGIVYDLEDIETSTMPKIAREFWNASACMNFCSEFLAHIKTVVQKDYNECIYKFEFNLGKEIEMYTLPPNSKFSFLPDWYISQVNEIIKSSN